MKPNLIYAIAASLCLSISSVKSSAVENAQTSDVNAALSTGADVASSSAESDINENDPFFLKKNKMQKAVNGDDPSSSKGALRSGKRIASWLKANIPSERVRCSVDHIMKIAGVESYSGDGEVGNANHGLMENLRRNLDQNRCFAKNADQFWQDVRKRLSATTRPASERKQKTNNLGQLVDDVTKPSITEEAGKGRFAGFEPGWLWRKAMAAAGGNGDVALNMLVLCTHDDIGQDLRYQSSPEEARESLLNEVEDLKRTINSLREKRARLDGDEFETSLIDSDLQGLNSKINLRLERIERKSFGENKTITCPTAETAVFAQKAVSPTFVVPDELKQEIVSAQRPDGKTENLASKAYHFMGGAYTGCKLAQCGLTPDQAGKMAGLAASAYRSIRLCTQVKELLGQQRTLADKLDIEPNAPNFPEKALEELRKHQASQAGKFQSSPSIANQRAGTPVDLVRLNPNVNLQNLLTAMDAAELYTKWYFSASVIGFDCTHIRVGGPARINAQDPAIEKTKLTSGKVPVRSLCGITGWSAERCSKARLKLSTWDADFKWTQTQHEIGARFGAEKCQGQGADKSSLDARSCPAENSGGLSPASSHNTNR